MKNFLIKLVCLAVMAGLAIAAGTMRFRSDLPAEAAALPPIPVTEAPAYTPPPPPPPTAAPAPTPTPEPEFFTLSFVGDCTLASSQHQKGTAAAFESVVGDDYAWPFAETVQYFTGDYLSLANMEGTFTDAPYSNMELFTFKSDAAYANVFVEGNIEFVTLANNHSGDYLQQGLEDTEAALDAVNVAWADDDGVCVLQRGDGPAVGVYAKKFPTAEQVVAGVARLKQAGAEVIVCALHWGQEGRYRPTADQENVGRAAIDAGAHIVYGAHPHVLQRMEEYKDGLILYSLGNWSFGGNTTPTDRDSAIIQVTVRRDPDGTVSLDGSSVIPCRICGEDFYNNYQPVPYEPDSEEYARTLSKLDGTFEGRDLVVDYSGMYG